jgi:lipoprotein-anchoring transpeptidase ErfK/SrfK
MTNLVCFHCARGKLMNAKFFEAREYVAQARESLQRGDTRSAWQLGKQAALAAPEMEDVWLVLTASAPDPQSALAHARKALEINPKSSRAQRAFEWANAQGKQPPHGTPSTSSRKIYHNKWLYAALLISLGCFVIGLLGFSAWTMPPFASILINFRAPVSTQENLWAAVDIAKPSPTPIDVSVFAPQIQITPSEVMSNVTTLNETATSTLLPTETPTPVVDATETSGTLIMEIVDDSQSNPPRESQAQFPDEGNGERWIDVNLSEQRVYAYEGDIIVNSFLVSTGLPETPTVSGRYQIWVKVRIQDMSGPGYYLKDVPYVMYFYKDYGLHGTYWHNNFGRPMSRGCVNLTIDDAKWLYNWASVGTVVDVHY